MNQPSQQSIDYSFDEVPLNLRDDSCFGYRKFSFDRDHDPSLFVPSASLRSHSSTVSSLPSLESIIHDIYEKLDKVVEDSKKRIRDLELALHTPPRPKRQRSI